MRTRIVIIQPPGLDDLPRFGQADEHVLVEALVAKWLLKLSMNAFCTGLPGSM